MHLMVRQDTLGTMASMLGMKNVFYSLKALISVQQSKEIDKDDQRPKKIEDLTHQLCGLLVGTAFKTNLIIPEFRKKPNTLGIVLGGLAIRVNMFLAAEYEPEELLSITIVEAKKVIEQLSRPSPLKESFRDYCMLFKIVLTDEDNPALSILEYVTYYLAQILEIIQEYNGGNEKKIIAQLHELIPEAEGTTAH